MMIEEKNIEDLRNYEDCKKCIHYWLHKEEELCTAENSFKYAHHICDEYEKA